MYIVKRGRLSVVADDESTVLATLSAGAVFGEVGGRDFIPNFGYFCTQKLWDIKTILVEHQGLEGS